MTIDISVVEFRERFPAMSDVIVFPDGLILHQSAMAQCFISVGPTLRGDCYQMAIYLMTAHLVWSDYLIRQGQTTAGIVTGATVSKVSVSITPPPSGSAWQFWLSTSPYGLQLWAFLNIKSAGGAYIGGLPERTAFRKVGGVFN
ncbi:Uncharacterised protein [Yersinia pseudotuberculosis]|uniref:DUF4054 domain-containing protein n=1 Tax=Yersinia pseudotuberculosis TaxID=633 RepID=UPI0005DAD239|nr:DUF4054 domain-containing protein [Yersinia pseudotuberculosis]CNH75861.1 Uncharacterised protein [Yersinia pseudotuberculosis]